MAKVMKDKRGTAPRSEQAAICASSRDAIIGLSELSHSASGPPESYGEPPAALDERMEVLGRLCCVGRSSLSGEAEGMKRRRSCPPVQPRASSFAGYRFPAEVIMLAVRWYLRFGLSYRDLEELLAERRIEVDHVTLYRWVQHFTPLVVDAARPCRHGVGTRWFVDETYVKVAGV